MRFVIESHEPLTQSVYHMRLSGDTRAIVRAGQFVQVQLPGFYLRRPISVCDCRPGEDGTQGVRGFVTDAMAPLEGQYDYVYACGPEPMLRAVHALCEKQDIHGQFSFEERMACGFGVCMGCSCKTKYGSKRICKDGPVLRREEILW